MKEGDQQAKMVWGEGGKRGTSEKKRGMTQEKVTPRGEEKPPGKWRFSKKL